MATFDNALWLSDTSGTHSINKHFNPPMFPTDLDADDFADVVDDFDGWDVEKDNVKGSDEPVPSDTGFDTDAKDANSISKKLFSRDAVPCFTLGTMILTAQGERPIEALKVGDMVVTQDSGLQPVRWIGRRTVFGRGAYAPVQFGAGALNGLTTPLLVSPQHRILLSGYQAELLFGESEVFAAADQLIGAKDV